MDLSSEQARRTPSAWSKGRKTDRIPIDREQVVAVALADLPPDAVSKGYEDVVVQDVLFRTDTELLRQKKFECVTPFTPLVTQPVAGLSQETRQPPRRS